MPIQPTNLLNVARFALSSPQRFAALATKVKKHLESNGAYSDAEVRDWIARNSMSAESYAKPLNPELWKEAQGFAKSLEKREAEIIPTLPFPVGGGADVAFLYFLTRLHRPKVIVETGVCMGRSSQAFLSALDANGEGVLYSSDLPLFRVKDPEKYVGILVENRLKSRWHLHIEGDQVALPRIVDSVERIDLFHFDSDKSYSGRQFATDLVLPKLRGPFVMDDIGDNSWFREFAEGREIKMLGREGFMMWPEPKGSES